MFFLSQAYVGLRDDDPFNILLEEKHLEHLLDCWLDVCVDAETCLVFATSSKRVITIPRMLPCGEELWGILSFFGGGWNILWQWLIVVVNHTREYLADKVCIIRVQCSSVGLKQVHNLSWHSFVGWCIFRDFGGKWENFVPTGSSCVSGSARRNLSPTWENYLGTAVRALRA